MKKVLLVVLCAFITISLVACGGNNAFKEAVTILEERGTIPFGTEEPIDITYYEIASDESYIKLDTNPYDIEDFYVAEASQLVADINVTLGFSESLYEKMMTTRALDGKQTDENNKFKVSWTYHPNNGLNVLYEKK